MWMINKTLTTPTKRTEVLAKVLVSLLSNHGQWHHNTEDFIVRLITHHLPLMWQRLQESCRQGPQSQRPWWGSGISTRWEVTAGVWAGLWEWVYLLERLCDNYLLKQKWKVNYFNWDIVDLQYHVSFRYTTEWFTSFIHYSSFIVIMKYWPYSLCWTVYPCSLFFLYIAVWTWGLITAKIHLYISIHRTSHMIHHSVTSFFSMFDVAAVHTVQNKSISSSIS